MLKLVGKTVVRVTTYSGGSMRKHGTWKQEDPLPGMTALPKVQGPRTSIIQRRNGTVIGWR